MQQRLRLSGQLLLRCLRWRLAVVLCMLDWQQFIMTHQLPQALLLVMRASMLKTTMLLRHPSPRGRLTEHWKQQIQQQQQQQVWNLAHLR
jgi:hypothetical protein